MKIIEAVPSDLEALRLEVGDVLLTDGGDFDKLGRGAIWNGQIADCIHQNHVFRVRTDRSCLLPHYFEAYLRSRAAKAYFLRCAKKTTNLASINMTQLRALPVMLPPVELQERFSRLVAAIDACIAECALALEGADRLFASVQSRAFNGTLFDGPATATQSPTALAV